MEVLEGITLELIYNAGANICPGSSKVFRILINDGNMDGTAYLKQQTDRCGQVSSSSC